MLTQKLLDLASDDVNIRSKVYHGVLPNNELGGIYNNTNKGVIKQYKEVIKTFSKELVKKMQNLEKNYVMLKDDYLSIKNKILDNNLAQKLVTEVTDNYFLIKCYSVDFDTSLIIKDIILNLFPMSNKGDAVSGARYISKIINDKVSDKFKHLYDYQHGQKKLQKKSYKKSNA